MWVNSLNFNDQNFEYNVFNFSLCILNHKCWVITWIDGKKFHDQEGYNPSFAGLYFLINLGHLTFFISLIQSDVLRELFDASKKCLTELFDHNSETG